MSFQNKYLKYKNKYLELKKQIGGALTSNSTAGGGGALQESNPDESTELIRQFISENSNISDQIISNPIDMRKKQTVIDKLIGTPDRQVMIDLYNSIKHVSALEHESLIKEFCDKYNQVKQSNDVYILVYIIKPGNSGSGALKYYTKSGLYVTTITGKYLNYDHIIDVTDPYLNNRINEANSKILESIKKLNIDTNKNIYLHFADDCSYSGEQLGQIVAFFTNDIFTNLNNNINLYYRFVVPFILDKKIINMIEEFSIISNYIKNYIDKTELSIKLQENREITKEQLKKFDDENKKLKYYDYDTFYKMQQNIFNEEKIQKSKIFIECIKSRQDGNINDLIKTIILGKKYPYRIDQLYLFDMYPVLNILKKNNSMIKKVENVVNGRPTSYKGDRYLVYFDTKIADNRSVETELIQNIVTNPDYVFGQYSIFKYKFNGKQIKFDDTKSFSQLLQSLK